MHVQIQYIQMYKLYASPLRLLDFINTVPPCKVPSLQLPFCFVTPRNANCDAKKSYYEYLRMSQTMHAQSTVQFGTQVTVGAKYQLLLYILS